MFNDIFTTCEALSEEALARYAELEMSGGTPQEQFAEVRAHLDRCTDCAERYADLLALLQAEAAGRVPPVSARHRFDLGFLPKKPKAKGVPDRASWRLDELGRLIVEFSTELLRSLQPPVYQPAFAVAGLKSKGDPRTLYKFVLTEALEGLEMTLSAERSRNDPDRCDVVVLVDVSEGKEERSLAGIEVHLKQGEQERDTQWTNGLGEAVFENISVDTLGDLVFEITPST